jgi:hypothetical protein
MLAVAPAPAVAQPATRSPFGFAWINPGNGVDTNYAAV